MKKIFIAPILLASAFALASCNGNSKTTTTTSNQNSNTLTTTSNVNVDVNKVSKEEFIEANNLTKYDNYKANFLQESDNSTMTMTLEKNGIYAKLTGTLEYTGIYASIMTGVSTTSYAVMDDPYYAFYNYEATTNTYSKTEGFSLTDLSLENEYAGKVYDLCTYDETKKAYVAKDIDIKELYGEYGELVSAATASYELKFENKKLISHKSTIIMTSSAITTTSVSSITIKHGTSTLTLPSDLLEIMENDRKSS